MSVIHPGSSLNFDGAHLQQSEEDEIQQEDIKQQQALHELLSAELPDDLLEESCEGSPGVSHERSYNGSHESEGRWHHQMANNTSQNSDQVRHDIQNDQYYRQMPPIPYSAPNDYNSYHPSQTLEQSFTDAEKWQMQQHRGFQFQPRNFQIPPQRDHGVGGYNYHSNNGGVNPVSSENDVYGFAERREAEGSEDFDAVSDYNRYDNKLSSTLPSQTGRTSTTPGKSVRFDAFSAPTSPYNYGGQVKYKAAPLHHYHSSDSINHTEANNKADDSVGSDYVDAMDRNTPESSDLSRELTQLRVLYEARGKKIDKLTREVEDLQQESSREKRILSHQLNMAKDEKNGMSGSLEECQRLLMEKDRLINESEAKVNSLKVEVEALKNAKMEQVRNMEVNERTIENLQQEVAMLQRSDSLDRARQQHEAVLATSNERHEQQMLEVTTMLDEMRRVADIKTEECDQLRLRLQTALKDSENLLLEKTDTINRLSRNLEEAQNQCQTLLAGSGESTYLHQQLSNITKEKIAIEEKTKAMQVDLNETKDQLKMFENAFHLGVTQRPQTSDGMTDSYSELMGGVRRNIDWKTPKIPGKKTSDDLVGSLRHELERALMSNKDKRDQITSLQNQIKGLSEEAGHWRERCDEAEKKIKIGILPSSSNRNTTRGSNDSMELAEALERAEQAEKRAIQLEATCREVKQQMCELIEQHDANKQEAVDRCERACMQLHEDAKHAIREELLAEYEQKSYEASIEHDGQLQEIKSEMESLSHELSEVKQSYVHVCAEKDSLEEKIKEEIIKEFENEKNLLISKHESQISEIRQEWDKVKNDEDRRREQEVEEDLKTKVYEAKLEWIQEQNQIENEKLEKILAEKETQFRQKLDQFEEELTKKFDQEQENLLEKERLLWEENKEKEIKLRMDDLYQELKEQENTAITTATSMAQLNWITEHQNKSEEDERKRVQCALDEARRTWKTEHENLLNEAVKNAVQDMQEELNMLKQHHEALLQDEIDKVAREWRRRKDEEMRKKENEMAEELKKLETRHQTEFAEFTKQHKMSLERFLESERVKNSQQNQQNNMTPKELMDDLRQQWNIERDQMLQSHRTEMERMKGVYETRCHDYKAEIQRLSSAYDIITQKSPHPTTPTSSEAIKLMETKHQGEMERLKSRMRDEYRRWKKERAFLQSKIPENSSQASSSVKREDLKQLREIYLNTLGCIKDEMLSYARAGRAQALSALQRESEKEKQRIFEKLRRRRDNTDVSVLPSFLVERKASSSERVPVKLPASNPPQHTRGRSRTTKSRPKT
uniref:Centrosomal protein of 152 kDa-like n=1 Tax=Phallusia mammillata TaxID=59560 RepID=A0A6F9D9T9_9ASCI|nr:centrosomal protein of 152 kDa-like [Phallusia mammillata]